MRKNSKKWGRTALSSLIFALRFRPSPSAVFQCGLSGQDGIDLVVEILDHDLRLEVDLIIVLCTTAVLFLLPVLAHHDERRLNGRDAGEHEVQQNERIGGQTLLPRAAC